MATSAQVTANQANAQRSTGPRTAQGQAIVGQNNFRHGFTGAFRVLDWENSEEYRLLYTALKNEHQPATVTEEMLVETMAQSYWLAKRALILQNTCFNGEALICETPQDLALYIRYQTTHDRAFHKALNALLKLRAEKRKQEIGFESHAHRQAEEARRNARENRKRDLHQYAVLLAEAKITRQQLLIPNQRSSKPVGAAAQPDKLTAQQAA